MTTICTDGKTMAGDGRSMWEDRIGDDGYCKVHRLKDGSLLGVAGSMAAIGPLVAWLNAGGKPSSYPKDLPEYSAMHLRLDGTLATYEVNGWPDPAAPPYAMGSGGAAAHTAMLCGKAPAEAVEIAKLVDAHTGGKITELSL